MSMANTETVVEPTKARKRRKNLTLDPDALRLAEALRMEDRRPSLVNELEHLIFAEAKRRGLPAAQAMEEAA